MATLRSDPEVLVGWRGLVACSAKALALTFRAGPIAFVCSAAITVALGLIPACVAWLTKELVNSLQFPDAAGLEPLLAVAAIAVLGAFAALLPHLSNYVKARLRRQAAIIVQDRLFSTVNGFDDIAVLEDPKFRDRLRLAHENAMSAPDRVSGALFGAMQNAISVSGFIVVLMAISPIVTAVTVVAAVPVLVVQLSISRQQAQMAWKLSPRNRRQLFYQALMLDLAAAKELRLFNLGGFLLGRMRSETRQINSTEDKFDRRVVLSHGPLAGLSATIAGCGLVWMVAEATRGAFDIGDITAFIASVTGVQIALGGLVASIAAGHQALLGFSHYVAIIDMSRRNSESESTASLSPLSSRIEFQDVWFRYTNDGPWILQGVSFTLSHGATLGLVGLNGAGKSTLVKLLCRLYEPTRGRIKWDGTDIRHVSARALRARISAVFQDYMMYDLSVSENIGIGDVANHADQSQIAAAAGRAGADDFIEKLAGGYDTMLSRIFVPADRDDPSSGVVLSGGQWQRLALARAFMRTRRDVLILDEPTSGLDPAAEQEINEKLTRHRLGSTSILISHRLAAVRQADHIVVLQGGVVIEEGSHASLLGKGGEYARLFNLQAAGYAAGEGESSARPEGTSAEIVDESERITA
ncbi:ABC transporter ATP-binding protein [Micromonospora sp. LOL_015]|uniref:ABC transporter ATP-binding protein n=1 Tax=Micromonospora sp. LOL_015 TaxID=3345416 RepID=UPI003A850578